MSPSCTRRPSARAPATRLRRSRAMPWPRRTASSSRFESLISSPCCGSATPARWHQSAQDSVERRVGQATISLGVRGRRPPLKSARRPSATRRRTGVPDRPLPSRPCRCVRRGRPALAQVLHVETGHQPHATVRMALAKARQARQQPVQAEGRHHRDHQLALPRTPAPPAWRRRSRPARRVPAGRRTGRSRSGAGRAPRGRTGPGRGGFPAA